MRSSPVRLQSLCAATVLGACVLGPVAARGALRPGHLPLTDSHPEALTPAGETPFACGTYRVGEEEHAWRRAVDLRVQREVSSGKRVKSAGLDYVYKDVWIIEDDGTLALTGANLFDTDYTTHRYAPGGGGVFTVSQVAFSYDYTLGTQIYPGDDGVVKQALPFGFPYAGSTWNDVIISGNGVVSFGDTLNQSGFYDSADFFSAIPKIAPLYLDLNVTGGGTVRVRSEATKYTVTWTAIPEFGTAKLNTMQLVLYPSGIFTMTYNAVGSKSQNNGLPVIIGQHPGGNPALEEISYSSELPFTSAGGSAVFEQYFNYTSPLVNERALLQRFYQQFPDEFFQLVFFTNFTQSMSGFANELNIKNDVTGIGLNIFDSSGQYGSNSVLESRCNMNSLGVWPSLDPAARQLGKGNNFLTIMGQESGHRWGAFLNFRDSNGQPSNLILGRSDAHWSYYVDVDHSSLEGGDWTDLGAGNWVCPTSIDYFSEIDEYTFGLRTPEEVKDFFYVSSVTNDGVAQRSVGTPLINATATGTAVPVTVADIQAVEGPRTPLEPDENKDLRQGFIFLLRAGSTPTQGDLDKIGGYRAAWEDYFERSCDGRLTCNTSLTQNFPVAVICGHVRNAVTSAFVPDFTAHSIERAFNQHVPAGGRYTFRYQANANSGSSEAATIVFTAPLYDPDTLTVDLDYGSTTCIDVDLAPVKSAVAITSFEATSREGQVVLRGVFRSNLGVEAVNVYRGDGVGEASMARIETVRDHLGERFEYVDDGVVPGRTYRYQIGVVDPDGEFFSPALTVAVAEIRGGLAQNRPNPFNPSTTIRFTLPVEGRATLTIHDSTGRRVRTLVDGVRGPGWHEVSWDGRDDRGIPASSGIYFYRLRSGRLNESRKMVLLK